MRDDGMSDWYTRWEQSIISRSCEVQRSINASTETLELTFTTVYPISYLQVLLSPETSQKNT